MKKRKNRENKTRNELFPASLLGICFGVLLLMSALHTYVVVLMELTDVYIWIQPLFPIVYWFCVAAGLTLFIRKKMRKTYEEPLYQIAEATERVAGGDFSVYVPTVHTPDKLDYLDRMILDFNRMVEELGSVETLKTDFVSNVSHEMKTPIAVIRNYAELLSREQVEGSARREYAENIIQAADRLSCLITNILRLNKLENQSIDPQMEIYDVCGQLEECILNYETVWDEKELELEAELENRAYIRADKSLLELVWNNLLSNAVKFTDRGGTVGIRQTVEGQDVVVSISDTGCGMDEKIMRHIFDRFYQGDTSHAGEGNGLGLALANRVLELMDGDITVRSEVGKGSIFTVKLPLAEENGRESRNITGQDRKEKKADD